MMRSNRLVVFHFHVLLLKNRFGINIYKNIIKIFCRKQAAEVSLVVRHELRKIKPFSDIMNWDEKF